MGKKPLLARWGGPWGRRRIAPDGAGTEKNAKAGIIARIGHEVSDHMPISHRLPLPG
jgi:hypothetical protein